MVDRSSYTAAAAPVLLSKHRHQYERAAVEVVMATGRNFRMLVVGLAGAAAGVEPEAGEVLTAVVEWNGQMYQRIWLETAGFPESLHTDHIGFPIDGAVSCCVVQPVAVGSVGCVRRGGEWASQELVAE